MLPCVPHLGWSEKLLFNMRKQSFGRPDPIQTPPKPCLKAFKIDPKSFKMRPRGSQVSPYTGSPEEPNLIPDPSTNPLFRLISNIFLDRFFKAFTLPNPSQNTPPNVNFPNFWSRCFLSVYQLVFLMLFRGFRIDKIHENRVPVEAKR